MSYVAILSATNFMMSQKNCCRYIWNGGKHVKGNCNKANVYHWGRQRYETCTPIAVYSWIYENFVKTGACFTHSYHIWECPARFILTRYKRGLKPYISFHVGAYMIPFCFVNEACERRLSYCHYYWKSYRCTNCVISVRMEETWYHVAVHW